MRKSLSALFLAVVLNAESIETKSTELVAVREMTQPQQFDYVAAVAKLADAIAELKIIEARISLENGATPAGTYCNSRMQCLEGSIEGKWVFLRRRIDPNRGSANGGR